MIQPDLRRILSDELHARAFHDFDGAGGSFALCLIMMMLPFPCVCERIS